MIAPRAGRGAKIVSMVKLGTRSGRITVARLCAGQRGKVLGPIVEEDPEFSAFNYMDMK